MAEPLDYGSVAWEEHRSENAGYRSAAAFDDAANGRCSWARVLTGAGVVAACATVAVWSSGALSHGTSGSELASSAHTRHEVGAHTRHEDKKSIGEYHNDTEWTGQTCYPEQVAGKDEYFTCPAGLYLGRKVADKVEVNSRLRNLYGVLRDEYHYEENKRENISGRCADRKGLF